MGSNAQCFKGLADLFEKDEHAQVKGTGERRTDPLE